MAEFLTEVNDDTFDGEVLKSDLPVIVDCWAEWCGPCKAMEPFLDKMAGEYVGKIKVVKLDTGVHTKYAEQYGVNTLPTLLIFKAGEVVDRQVGGQNPAKLKKLFSSI